MAFRVHICMHHLSRQRVAKRMFVWLRLSAVCLCASLPMCARGQSTLPDAPQPVMPTETERQAALAREAAAQTDTAHNADVTGTVVDAAGGIVPGALVLLHPVANASSTVGDRAVLSDSDGDFTLDHLPDGNFTLQISSPGFLVSYTSVILQPNESHDVKQVILPVGVAASVRVVATQHEMATEQVHLEEKQRVLGVFPNFYISYLPNSAPLSKGQKFGLAFRSLVDPISFVLVGATAGIEQASDTFNGYGEGAAGYGKRYGAALADNSVGTVLAGAVFPVILRQDPRYFWKGTGTKRQRALYAISRTVVCKGDNGKWQPNYSNVLGNFASAGISNLYYPDSDRDGIGLTLRNVLIGTAAGGLANLYQEFFSRKMTPAAERTTDAVKRQAATSDSH